MTTPLDVLAQWPSLEAMPQELRAAAGKMSAEAARTPPADGGFSLVEQAWHLADLEREGYGERIRRLLAEEDPALPDFDGARVAAERNYRTLSLVEGIAAFSAARTANLARLRSVPEDGLGRAGHQEGVGRVTLRDVPPHDARARRLARAEIAALLAGQPIPRDPVSA
jgi:hypothetical protein